MVKKLDPTVQEFRIRSPAEADRSWRPAVYRGGS